MVANRQEEAPYAPELTDEEKEKSTEGDQQVRIPVRIRMKFVSAFVSILVEKSCTFFHSPIA